MGYFKQLSIELAELTDQEYLEQVGLRRNTRLDIPFVEKEFLTDTDDLQAEMYEANDNGNVVMGDAIRDEIQNPWWKHQDDELVKEEKEHIQMLADMEFYRNGGVI